MLTISQLAAYAGVTVRAVRHYHQIGLLPEPERDASGYRRYGAQAVVSLIKIRTLANAGVPLSQLAQMLDADAAAFAEAVERIDARLREEIERLSASREQIAQLAAGDSLALPPAVVAYLGRLREIGVSERMIDGERDGWILISARWPERIAEIVRTKLAELADPRMVRLYQILTELFESDQMNEPLMAEAADIMAALNEEAYAAQRQASLGDAVDDDMSFDLLEGLALEADPRARRMVELMRERGWDGWVRLERLPTPATVDNGRRASPGWKP